VPTRRSHSATPSDPAEIDREVVRLSEDLKAQVRRAKDRISDTYGKLMEPVVPGGPRGRKG